MADFLITAFFYIFYVLTNVSRVSTLENLTGANQTTNIPAGKKVVQMFCKAAIYVVKHDLRAARYCAAFCSYALF